MQRRTAAPDGHHVARPHIAHLVGVPATEAELGHLYSLQHT
jgi:hypothetical protein